MLVMSRKLIIYDVINNFDIINFLRFLIKISSCSECNQTLHLWDGSGT